MNITSPEGAKIKLQDIKRLGDAHELQKGDAYDQVKRRQIENDLLLILLAPQKNLIFC